MWTWFMYSSIACSETNKEDCYAEECTEGIEDTGMDEDTAEASLDTSEPTSEPEDDMDTDEDIPIDPCEGIDICDNFDDYALGNIPPASHWTIETPNCSGNGEAMVADDFAYSGTQSIKVMGAGGYCDHIFIAPTEDVSAIGPILYGRFWMRIDSAFGWEHSTFLAMKDEIEGKDLRMGGQSQIMMWNRESDDATLPELSPTGISMSYAPIPQEWTCVSFAVDERSGTIETWIDGDSIEGLTQDNEPTPDIDRQWVQQKPDWAPSLIDIKLGWESYGEGSNIVWYDDIAFSSTPLACD